MKTTLAVLLLFVVLVFAARADQVVPDDFVVQGNAVFGIDAVNNEAFGLDTIRLKENVLRIHFDDRGDIGEPSNDWRLVINDQGAGGQNYFAISDAGNDGADRQVFRVMAGAPTNAFVIDASGNVTIQGSLTANNTSLITPPGPIAFGDSGVATATGQGALAVGAGASARANDTAIGFRSTVTADGSTAVGANTRVDGTNAVAVGADSIVEGGTDGGTALGQNARVRAGASRAVALGKDSEATESDTVSVGSATTRRRITNVADGVAANDAVNRRQLDAVRGEMAEMRTGLADMRAEANENRREARAGIAAAAAMAAIVSPSAPGKTTVNVGVANFKSESALGLGAAHRLKSSKDLMVNVGLSFADDAVVSRAGARWEF